MKVGVDSYTIRELKLNGFQTLDYVKSLGLDGIQFGSIGNMSKSRDIGELDALRQYANEAGLYIDTGVDTCNPAIFRRSEEEQREAITRDIRIFAKMGWHELRSVISYYDERYVHPVPWETHLQKSISFLQSLRPALEECGSRINLENHGDSTFDLLHIVEAVGPDICGFCLDTANTLVNAEDPVMAAKRVAPYTQMTHCKDGITFFSENGVSRQGKPPGQGIVDFAQIIPILHAFNPNLNLSIEDHKMIFEFRIFDPQWMSRNLELSTNELAQYIKMTVQTENKLTRGEIPSVAQYEQAPYLQEMEQRVKDGAQHLRSVLKEIEER